MNRKLFKSIREYRRESILAPVFVILEVLMEVLIPLQMAKIHRRGNRAGKPALYCPHGRNSGGYGHDCPVLRRYGRKVCGGAAAGLPKSLRQTFFS